MPALSYLRFEFVRSAGDTLATNRVVLDKGGPTYRIKLRWLPQAATWILDMSTTAGAVIVSGAWVRDRVDVLLGIASPGRPRGAIIAYDAKGRGDPGPDAWTLDDVGLWYLPGGFDPEMFSLYQTAIA